MLKGTTRTACRGIHMYRIAYAGAVAICVVAPSIGLLLQKIGWLGSPRISCRWNHELIDCNRVRVRTARGTFRGSHCKGGLVPAPPSAGGDNAAAASVQSATERAARRACATLPAQRRKGRRRLCWPSRWEQKCWGNFVGDFTVVCITITVTMIMINDEP